MRATVAVSIALVAGPGAPAAAEPERFRIGADGAYNIAYMRGGSVGISGEVPYRSFSLRGRLEYGAAEYCCIGPKSAAMPGFERRTSDVWAVTAGPEGRADVLDDGSMAVFANVTVGVARVSDGFLGPTASYRGIGRLQLGFEVRSEMARFRPSLTIGAQAGRDVSGMSPLALLVAGSLGVDLAF